MTDDNTAPTLRRIEDADRPWLRRQLDERWGGPHQFRRGRSHDVSTLPGFVTLVDGAPQGFACYEVSGDEAELAVLDAGEATGVGTGTALVEAVVDASRAAGAWSLWVVTTNDNLRALRFYQRRGFELRELRPGAVDDARRSKPSIALVGADGIPIRDELELRRPL